MPPRIRTRASKALKENINVTGNKLKTTKSNTKASRKPLADKTNSASDDASLEIPKSKETITKSVKEAKQNGVKRQNVQKKQNNNDDKPKSKQKSVTKEKAEPVNDVRPRRERRLPTRFVENHILNNLSNSKDSVNITHNSSILKANDDNTPVNNKSPSKNDKLESADPSPFKTPAKADSSLLASRPRRICRLPSRFEDHSVSPNKYIPIQPASASTPIPQSKAKLLFPPDNVDRVSKDSGNKKVPNVGLTRLAENALQKQSSDKSSDKSSPDSNNNAKGRSTRVKKPVKKPAENKKQAPNQSQQNTNQSIKKFFTSMNRTQSPLKNQYLSILQSPVKKTSPKKINSRKIIDKNLSFKVLEGKKKSQESNENDYDIYEFTFDPKEEPLPQKKKRKKPVTKKPSNSKPKRVVYKSNYDQNISKALAALKTSVKPGKTVESNKLIQITENDDEVQEIGQDKHDTNNVNKVQKTNVNKETVALNDTGKNSVHECNYPSIRVEDIAADIEPSMDHHDDINYSPVNSPRPNVPMPQNSIGTPHRSIHNNDPLNLQEELSFFDDQPVASSSMNMSARHPLASPWRVEFGSLPIKWPVNTYVKPNMTPAVESSFISAEDSHKKKHVYTNMLPQPSDTLLEIMDHTPTFKQTSILSFIQEMAEKSAKKKRGRSVSPTKAIYEEIIDKNAKTSKTTKKTKDNKEATSVNTSEEASGTSNNTSNDRENSKEEKRSRKRKNNENICDRPTKSPRKQKDKDCTYFGFDDSENQDNQEQENVSPIKINNNPKRSLRSRRTVLQEINGPTRAALPVAAKTKIVSSSDAVNRVYEELKSAADAPVFPEKNVNADNATNIEDILSNEDSQSVHLFEDIEVVHHLKPTRKSYGKAKKVTFRQRSNSDSDTREDIVAQQNDSSDYDDLADLTFEINNVQEKKTVKKKKPKNLRSKKEEQEAETWAANFNSMCEDIEEFPLLVE